MIRRRDLVVGLPASLLFLRSGSTWAETIASLNLQGPSSRDLSDILLDAQNLGLTTPVERSVRNIVAADIATIVLEGLDRSARSRSISRLARRAGTYLSSINPELKDIKSADLARRAPPPFNIAEKRRLKHLFTTCTLSPKHKDEVSRIVKFILRPDAVKRYKDVESATGIKWYAIAALHYREANLNFFGHLHNGDRLDKRTRQVPAGRPHGPWPPKPFDPKSAWKRSAIDALSDFPDLKTQHIEPLLFYFEAYNGFGPRWHHINTPYVWSYSNHYSAGGAPCDHCWSDTYVSKQAGLGLVIRALHDAAPADVPIVFQT